MRLVGCFAGYGVHSDIGLSIPAFLPVDLRQITNTADLFAAVQALGATASCKIAICIDSTYVYGAAMYSARPWKARGWRNSTRAMVPNITCALTLSVGVN
mmetsp:Transcript_147464/g.257807  ORF Transcript_147464/g.257807 Transcript_147464/m.257807 type:complete len:100 (-) Transcript_147464:206-505(-)